MVENVSSLLMDSLDAGDFEKAEELLTSKSTDDSKDQNFLRDLISQTITDGKLLLHTAIRSFPNTLYKPAYDSPYRVVKRLLALCPEIVATKNKYGITPLHFAASESQVPFSIINTILEMRPESIKEKTANGNLPIHRAVAGHREWKEVKILLEKYPDSIRAKNNNGSTLLHYAVDSPQYETIDELMRMCPALIKELDGLGDLPMHKIVNSQRWLSEEKVKELLEKLIKAYPEGVKHKNKKGYLPIHKAANAGMGEATIMLAKEYPQSVYGSESPIMLYCQNGSFPKYRIRVVHQMLSFTSSNIMPTNDDDNNKFQKMSERLESVINERNSLRISLQSAKEEKENHQNKVISIEQEKESLKGSLKYLQNNVTSINKEREEIEKSLGMVMKTETETRKSEQVLISLLGKAENDESVPVSVEKLKSIANSLNDRVANFKSKVEPNCKQSSAEFFFSCFIQNKDLSKLLLVQAITALNKELVEVEKTFYDGIDKSSNFRNTENRESVNIESNLEKNVSTNSLSSETSDRDKEPATKRPRVSLSPQSTSKVCQNQNEESEIPAEIEIPVKI